MIRATEAQTNSISFRRRRTPRDAVCDWLQMPVASSSRSDVVTVTTPSSHFYYRQIGRRPATWPDHRLLAIQRITAGSIAINRSSQMLIHHRLAF